MSYQYDLLVIGAGSGGVRAARMAAAQGAKTAIIETRHLGGTCVNIGCVPKKLMSYAAHYAYDFKESRGFGWDVAPSGFSWSQLIDNKNAEINRLNGIYENLLSNANVEIIEGYGAFIDPHHVKVSAADGSEQTISAEKILIAVGGVPSKPDDTPGVEHAWVSDDVFYLEKMPKKVVVAGAGYIAVEFAGIFKALGADVTLVYRGEEILRGFDLDVRRFLRQEIEKKGIKVLLHSTITQLEKQGDQLEVTFSNGEKLTSDGVLYAIGRKPNIAKLGLENIGVETRENGAIKVNQSFQTNIDSVFALGDVTDRINLTPVAIAEAMVFVKQQYQNQPEARMDYQDVASAVFSQPNVACVGLSEEQALSDGYKIDVYQSDFRPMKHTLSGSDERCYMKMIVDQDSDRVLGVHMVGLDSPEIIQGMAIALKAGATKAVFDATIGIHPTAAEEFVTMRTKRGA